MDPAEILFRMRAVLDDNLERVRLRRGIEMPRMDVAPESTAAWLGSLRSALAVDRAAYRRRADALLDGRFVLLDGSESLLGFPPPWNRNPVDGAPWPASSGIVDPQPGRGADVRLLLELHRHSEAVALAQAWHLTRAPRYLQGLRDYLEHWLMHCPYPIGPGWSSALEAGLRLINWSIAWQLAGGYSSPMFDDAAGKKLRAAWLSSVYVHARHVRRNYSRFSSANNHLIGELAGLYAAGATWPLWLSVRRWGEAARRELNVQLLAQVAPDGSGREQSTGYLAFVFGLFAVVHAIGRARGEPLELPQLERLRAAIAFIKALTDSDGHVASLGDTDSAPMPALDPDAGTEAFGVMRSLAAAMGLVHADAAPRSDAAAWLFGALPAAQPATGGAAAPSSETLHFKDGGYCIVKDFGGPGAPVEFGMDAGPLGYLGIAAHGHADALSLWLSVGGRPLLVDRGTYVYNTQPEARQYHRSTLAHNTVTVDGRSQSEPGGPFIWTQKANVRLLRFTHGEVASGVVTIDGEHDGYRRLSDPVIHRREVQWCSGDRLLAVTDELRGRLMHEAAIQWHFAPECKVHLVGERLFASREGATAELCIDTAPDVPAGTWRLYRGEPDELHGWHSPRFGLRVPAATAVWSFKFRGTVRVRTLLKF